MVECTGLLNQRTKQFHHRFESYRSHHYEVQRKKYVNISEWQTTEIIKIDDNDRLAARIAQIAVADLLILLSDIDGLYDKNPKTHKDAKFISVVENIDEEIEAMASILEEEGHKFAKLLKIK